MSWAKVILLITIFVEIVACLDCYQPFIAPKIAEVEIKGGSAHATNVHPQAAYAPEKAFTLGSNTPWHIGGGNMRMFPVMVWYEFPKEQTFIPARVSFRCWPDYCETEGPTVWQFVGSNDESCGKYGHWTVLCEDKSNNGYSTKYWTKYCDVDKRILNEFRCLGISVLNTHSATGETSLKDVRIWKRIFK